MQDCSFENMTEDPMTSVSAPSKDGDDSSEELRISGSDFKADIVEVPLRRLEERGYSDSRQFNSAPIVTKRQPVHKVEIKVAPRMKPS